MNREHFNNAENLIMHAEVDECQRCFVGHSHEAPWRDDLVSACNEVLPEFGLKPWYATDHFTPTKSLRKKIIEMIANTHYGIYDLSYWRKDNEGEWSMPRNVFIELGIAIALNRPTLLLRHSENYTANIPLPLCLESISPYILEFSGLLTLRRILRERLLQSPDTVPKEDWWNRYCTFGDRVCEYREAHPYKQQWGLEKLHCHIADSSDVDRHDFRDIIEEVLGRFEDVEFKYLDALTINNNYSFLLCSHCQTVRSTPFAIYRITPQSPPETFIAIGMSLALEMQFSHEIPKILLTSNMRDIPSLLTGYDVVVAQNDYQRMTHLRNFMPQVIQEVRRTTWKARPLPFIQVIPRPKVEIVEYRNLNMLNIEVEQELQADSHDTNDSDPSTSVEINERTQGLAGQQLGRFRLLHSLGTGDYARVYKAEHIHLKTEVAIKVREAQMITQEDQEQFKREALLLASLKHPNIVQVIDFDVIDYRAFLVLEYAPYGTPKLINGVPLPPLRVASYIKQIAAALQYMHDDDRRLIHCNIKPANMLLWGNNLIKLGDFGIAERGHDSKALTLEKPVGTVAFMAPEHLRGMPVPASDQYSLAVVAYEWLSGDLPFHGGSLDIQRQHMYENPPPLRRRNLAISMAVEQVINRALRKNPRERYPCVLDFAEALESALKSVSYSTSANTPLEANGKIISSPLEEPIVPLSHLDITSIRENEEVVIQIRWHYEGKGEMRILKSDEPFPNLTNKVLPEIELSKYGQTLLDWPDQVTDVWNKTGVAYYTPVVIFQQMAYVGNSQRFVCVDNVSNLRYQNIGTAIRFHWKWPENCQEVLVAYSTFDWPRSVEDRSPNVSVTRVNWAQYDQMGYFDLQGVNNQQYYILLSAIIDDNGTKIVAQSIRVQVTQATKLEVTYEIKTIGIIGNRKRKLCIKARTAGTLPAVQLIARQGRLPFTKRDGDLLQSVGPIIFTTMKKEEEILLAERDFPRGTLAKLFLDDDDRHDDVVIHHPGTEKLRLS